MNAFTQRCRSGLALGLLGAAVASWAQTTEARWGSDLHFSRTFRVAPDKPLELCADMPRPARLAWSFEASQALHHAVYRAGAPGGAEAPANPAWRQTGTMDVPQAGRYCLSWTNPTDKPIELAVDLAQQPR